MSNKGFIMKHKIILLAAILLAACGDDSSTGPAAENTLNSSSATAPISSSIDDKPVVSSSSVANDNGQSSSAEKNAVSSSSAKSSGGVGGSTPANYDAATNTVTDERDGKKYRTVTIGSQTWFAENLAYGIFYDDTGAPAYHCPDNVDENCETYGYLYTQDGFADSVNSALYSPAFPDSVRPYKGICPTGWHIPSIDEWQILLDEVPGLDLLAESAGGTGKSGFDVLLAGLYSSGTQHFGVLGVFATVDEASNQHMYYAEFRSTGHVSAGAMVKWGYVSVRCLMD